VIVPGREAAPCPEHCLCYPGQYVVICKGPSSTAVPSVRLTHVRALYISYVNIPFLERDSFVFTGLTELDCLWIFGCGLKTMDVGAFNSLTKLTNLSLSLNLISKIKPGTFEKLSRLKSLDLSNNHLEHLDDDAFRGLFNLNFINLGFSKLQSLYPGTFRGLPNIRFIKLQANPGLRIPTDGPFIQSQSLTHLDISLCNISSLSGETFANLPALEWLDVTFNQLSTVDVAILTELPKLKLMLMFPNPIQGDCKLKELAQKYKDIAIWTADIEVRLNCDRESEVVGDWVKYSQGLREGICIYKINTNIDLINSIQEKINSENEYTDAVKKQHSSTSSFLKHFQLPVYAIPFIFGATCNVILLIIITCNKDMRTVPNMYIINLATIDIIYLTVLFSEACANRISDTWLEGEFMCTFL
jgi:hypothetical protein